jgi:Flp pilus assembly protein TadD
LSECEIAIELNPSDAVTRMQLGNRLDLLGRTEEGVAHMEQGLRMNPFDPIVADYMGYLARAMLSQGDAETALAWARKGLARRPDHPDTLFRVAACLAALGDPSGAKRALHEAETVEPGFLSRKSEWSPYKDPERNDRFFWGLRRHSLH